MDVHLNCLFNCYIDSWFDNWKFQPIYQPTISPQSESMLLRYLTFKQAKKNIEIIWNHMKSYEIIWSHMKSYEVIWHHPIPSPCHLTIPSTPPRLAKDVVHVALSWLRSHPPGGIVRRNWALDLPNKIKNKWWPGPPPQKKKLTIFPGVCVLQWNLPQVCLLNFHRGVRGEKRPHNPLNPLVPY